MKSAPPALPMVGWYDPRQLVPTAADMAASVLFGRRAHYRILEAPMAPKREPETLVAGGRDDAGRRLRAAERVSAAGRVAPACAGAISRSWSSTMVRCGERNPHALTAWSPMTTCRCSSAALREVSSSGRERRASQPGGRVLVRHAVPQIRAIHRHALARVLVRWAARPTPAHIPSRRSHRVGWTMVSVVTYARPFGSSAQLLTAGAIIVVLVWITGAIISGLCLLVSLNGFGRHSKALSSRKIPGLEEFPSGEDRRVGRPHDLSRRNPPRAAALESRRGRRARACFDPDDPDATAPELIEPPIVCRKIALPRISRARYSRKSKKGEMSHEHRGR